MPRKVLGTFDFTSAPTVNGTTTWFPSPTGTNASGTWDISITGSAAQLGGVAAASYALKADTTFVGTTSIALNRASASQALTGISSIDGSAATLTTGRTIGLTGIVTGTATSFNGSANISIPVTAVDLGNANNTGTIATARLGSGTANTTTFLRGDNTWATPAGGGGTTTNALTMNNAGSGAASGSTFNGSAAITLSYNTIGAAPLASPTFTGTPAAPTAAVGTNTTQLATTAYVLAAVKQIPSTAQNTAYTLVAGDAGRVVKHTDTTARTYTINNSVFAADDVVTLANYTGTGAITVASGAGFTLYLAGTTTTGSRTIAVRGIATIVFESASVGYISGPGVT